MSIQSSAFGRVTLTEEDAAKFTRQVRYGRPKAAAVESVKRGIKLARELSENGRVKVTVTTPAR